METVKLRENRMNERPREHKKTNNKKVERRENVDVRNPR
jgi:hypothetical protein